MQATPTVVDFDEVYRTEEPRSGSQSTSTYWLLREDEYDGQVFAVLTTSHLSRGLYYARIANVAEKRENGFISTRFAPFSATLVFKTQHGSRYSAKALASVHESALGVVRDMVKYREPVAARYFVEDAELMGPSLNAR